jgi:hypothetical protein
MRYLKPHEIEIRVGTISKTKPKAMLLLYKDARCDMAILDEIYGSENWQSEFVFKDRKVAIIDSSDKKQLKILDNYEESVLFCSIGVYNKEIGDWVWKSSNGVESQGTGSDDPNNKKGEASDSFKRAGFMWGIGRELYKWKGLWIEYDKNKDKYENYSVTKITYDDNEDPKDLEIVNSKGNIVYKMENGYYKKVKANTKAKQEQQVETQPQAENEPVSDENDIDERMEQDVINDIKQTNKKIWADLVFEGVKVLERITNYENEDLKPMSQEYLKMFIKQNTNKPMTQLEFSKTDKAPELKGWEVVVVDSELEVKFDKFLEKMENDDELF